MSSITKVILPKPLFEYINYKYLYLNQKKYSDYYKLSYFVISYAYLKNPMKITYHIKYTIIIYTLKNTFLITCLVNVHFI